MLLISFIVASILVLKGANGTADIRASPPHMQATSSAIIEPADNDVRSITLRVLLEGIPFPATTNFEYNWNMLMDIVSLPISANSLIIGYFPILPDDAIGKIKHIYEYCKRHQVRDRRYTLVQSSIAMMILRWKKSHDKNSFKESLNNLMIAMSTTASPDTISRIPDYTKIAEKISCSYEINLPFTKNDINGKSKLEQIDRIVTALPPESCVKIRLLQVILSKVSSSEDQKIREELHIINGIRAYLQNRNREGLELYLTALFPPLISKREQLFLTTTKIRMSTEQEDSDTNLIVPAHSPSTSSAAAPSKDKNIVAEIDTLLTLSVGPKDQVAQMPEKKITSFTLPDFIYPNILFTTEQLEPKFHLKIQELYQNLLNYNIESHNLRRSDVQNSLSSAMRDYRNGGSIQKLEEKIDDFNNLVKSTQRVGTITYRMYNISEQSHQPAASQPPSIATPTSYVPSLLGKRDSHSIRGAQSAESDPTLAESSQPSKRQHGEGRTTETREHIRPAPQLIHFLPEDVGSPRSERRTETIPSDTSQQSPTRATTSAEASAGHAAATTESEEETPRFGSYTPQRK